MWKENPTSITSSVYEKVCSPKIPTAPFKHFVILNGSHRVRAFKRLRTRHEYIYELSEEAHELWGSAHVTPAKGIMWKESLEHKRFGVSLTGIKAKKEEISIDPKKLETNVFYLFSYKDEKYVARKSDNDVIEIYEVIE